MILSRVGTIPVLLSLRAVIGLITLMAFGTTSRAQITSPFAEGAPFDSLTYSMQMHGIAGHPDGSFYDLDITISESADSTPLISTLPYSVKNRFLDNGPNSSKYFATELVMLRSGIRAPEHWLPEWWIPYFTFVDASVSGVVYPDGSGMVWTRTYTHASPAGSFFPNWPAVATISGSVTLNGDPGEGELRAATHAMVIPPPVGSISTGSGSSRVFVDRVQTVENPQLVDIESELSIAFTNETYLHKFLDYDPEFVSLGMREGLHMMTSWGFDELPGEVPTKPSIGIIRDSDSEVYTSLKGLNETFFISSGTFADVDVSRSFAAGTVVEDTEASFEVINNGHGFAAFRLPDMLSPAAYTFTIGTEEYGWDGMGTFDFLAINPEGVDRFKLEGPGLGSFSEMPLFSTRFAGDGPVSFIVSNLAPVPEPSSALLAIIPMGLFLLARLPHAVRDA